MRSIKPLIVALAVASLTPSVLAQDVAKGRELFQDRCAVCHAISMDGAAQGPNLSSVVGRAAGAVPNFSYTKELRDSKLVWNTSNLDKYLENPSALVPGTQMPIMVPSASERQNLIAFLGTVRGAAIQPAITNARVMPPTATDIDPEAWQQSKPGVKHRIAVTNLPQPFATNSARNAPRGGARP